MRQHIGENRARLLLQSDMETKGFVLSWFEFDGNLLSYCRVVWK